MAGTLIPGVLLNNGHEADRAGFWPGRAESWDQLFLVVSKLF